MELWIRSQNKGALIKVEMLGNTDGTINSYKGINQAELGTYKSSERALEVLDEIQNLLQPKIIYTQQDPIETYELGVYQLKQDVDMEIQEVNRIVYEMPKE